jgi:hypothetical protein
MSDNESRRRRDTRAALAAAACSVTLIGVAAMGASPAQAAVHPVSRHVPRAAVPHDGTTSAELEGVSCPTGTTCLAVGWHAGASGPTRTLAERWSGGHWSIVGSATPAGAADSELDAVSCASATSCQAIGFTAGKASSSFRFLAERWNGRAWSRVPIPTIANASLAAIACPSSSMCMAVGTQSTGGGDFRPVSERWNGRKWARVATPQPANAKLASVLSDVSCSGARSCVAVGDSNVIRQSRFSALAERWNGKKWTILRTGAPKGAVLNGVSCRTAASCATVGATQPVNGDSRLLAGNLSGSRWSFTAPKPAKGMIAPGFNQVSCSAAKVCTAIVESISTSGDQLDFSVASRTANGGWAVAQPGSASATDVLRHVSCRPVACTVVGGAGTTDGQGDRSGSGTTFAERGKGSHLMPQPMPPNPAS